MKDIYTTRDLLPMTIGGTPGPLDDDAFLYELKFDGFRCMAYLDPEKGTTEIRSKRNKSLMANFPELDDLHRLVTGRCVLDGELVVFNADGSPNFEELQRRGHLRKPLGIAAAANQTPASLIVFDVLYIEDERLTDLPLWQRKERLDDVVAADDAPAILQVSVFTEGDGNAILSFAKAHELEGAIAKRRDSRYLPGVRTKEWFKVKLLADDDFVVCGFIDSEKANVTTLILGQYDPAGQLVEMGHVVLGRQRGDYAIIEAAPKAKKPPFTAGSGDAGAVWLKPTLVCTVTFSYRRLDGSMRHAKYKGLRDDKLPEEAVAPTVLKRPSI